MNREEQRELTLALLASLQKDLLEKIDAGKLPPNWDGNEIRAWLLFTVKDRYVGFGPSAKEVADSRTMRGRNFKNDILIYNL